MKRKGQNRHHLVPKSRRLTYKTKKVTDVTIWMNIEKHKSWHHIFGDMTLHESIEFLQRICKIKFGAPYAPPMVKPTHY